MGLRSWVRRMAGESRPKSSAVESDRASPSPLEADERPVAGADDLPSLAQVAVHGRAARMRAEREEEAKPQEEPEETQEESADERFQEDIRMHLGFGRSSSEARREARLAKQSRDKAEQRYERAREVAASLRGLTYSEVILEHCRSSLRRYVDACAAREQLRAIDPDFLIRPGFSDDGLWEANAELHARLSVADELRHQAEMERIGSDGEPEAVVSEHRAKLLEVLGPGDCSVVLKSVCAADPDGFAILGDEMFVQTVLVLLCGYDDVGAFEMVQRVEHLGGQEIISGASFSAAVEIKETFQRMGIVAEIKELRASGGRQSIPERVRHEVWRRDEGRCVECGSQENLEFDHIIPVSKGGANTARNLQLLCQSCNRAKSDKI